MICPPGKSMIFQKKETEKNELVTRPASGGVGAVAGCLCGSTANLGFGCRNGEEVGIAPGLFRGRVEVNAGWLFRGGGVRRTVPPAVASVDGC